MSTSHSDNDRGSMLLEFILVMPILILLIFGIVQFSLILMAKQLTQYAAFCAARAAIVYNPADYRSPNAPKGGGFYTSSGPVFNAASKALSAFKAFSHGTSQAVSIDANQSADLQEAANIPAVKVAVSYKYPLLIPYAAEVIGYLHAGGDAKESWDITGFTPGKDFSQKLKSVSTKGTPMFSITESCTMPRPWSTDTFPKSPDSY